MCVCVCVLKKSDGEIDLKLRGGVEKDLGGVLRTEANDAHCAGAKEPTTVDEEKCGFHKEDKRLIIVQSSM